MTQRILSISGLRGVIGDGLDPTFLVNFGAALGTLANGGAMVLSRDGRASGQMVKHALLAGLTAAGCRVIDADIASTPTCGVLVRHLGAAGGVQITASHNPIEWNGVKPFSEEGSVYDQARGERLLALLKSRKFRLAQWRALGKVETLYDAEGPHMERVQKLVDAALILPPPV